MKQVRKVQVFSLVALLITLALAACGDVTPTEESISVDEHFEQGNKYAQSGEYDKAIAEYEAVLELEPDNVSALTNLGVVYYSTGQLDLAIAQYQKALEIAPQDADIHSNLAAAYVQTNQLDEALEEYLTAADLNPDLAEAHFGLGVVYMQLDKDDKAIQAFERFQELDQGQDPMASDGAKQYLEQLKGQ